MIKLAPHPDGHLRTDRAVAIQNVNTARHTVVVDVVLTNNAKRDAVVYLTRSHVYTLWEQKVGGCEGDGILVVYEVLRVLRRRCTDEYNSLAVAGQCVDSGKRVTSRVDWCNSDVACTAARKRNVCKSNELEQRTCAFTRLWVNCKAVSYSEHVASLDGCACTSASDGDGGRPKQTYNLKIRDWTWYSEFTDNRVSFLAAKDENGKVRFKWGEMKPKQEEPKFKPAAAPVEVQEEVQPAPVQVADEANVKGILKPQADEESDPIRDALIAEYNQLYGKNPDKRMKNETIKKAIQDKVDEILDEGSTEEEEVEEESISDYFDQVKSITDPKQFIQWAKDTVAKFPDAPQEHVDMFKELCNAHYKSIM